MDNIRISLTPKERNKIFDTNQILKKVFIESYVLHDGTVFYTPDKIKYAIDIGEHYADISDGFIQIMSNIPGYMLKLDNVMIGKINTTLKTKTKYINFIPHESIEGVLYDIFLSGDNFSEKIGCSLPIPNINILPNFQGSDCIVILNEEGIDNINNGKQVYVEYDKYKTIISKALLPSIKKKTSSIIVYYKDHPEYKDLFEVYIHCITDGIKVVHKYSSLFI